MVTCTSILVRLLLVLSGGAERLMGKPTTMKWWKLVAFHPERPLLGKVPPGRLGEAHLRLKVHDVAFMLRALRTVVRDVRPDAPDGGLEPLTKRFPAARVPEDRKVRQHCRHDFVSCVTYLSKVAHTLSLSTENDLPTLVQGRRKGMCFKDSRRLRIFCSPFNKEALTSTTKVKKDITEYVSSALKKPSKEERPGRLSIGDRMITVKPAVPKKKSELVGLVVQLILSLQKLNKTEKIKTAEENVLLNVANTTSATKLELYMLTVTALQYMCWYTMHGVPYLAHLLQCDSSKPKHSHQDGDSRANDYTDPFGCSLYSFCPNPCCGGLREPSMENCWNRFSNPCRLHGLKGGRGCRIPRELNLNYHHLVDHGVQVSCDCGAGRRYEPTAGMCVSQDHCTHHATCPKPHQHCYNLYGGHACRCDPDYRWRDHDQRCVPIYFTKKKEREDQEEEEGQEEGEEENVKKEKGQPFFKWLNNLFDTRLEVPETRRENYNWTLL